MICPKSNKASIQIATWLLQEIIKEWFFFSSYHNGAPLGEGFGATCDASGWCHQDHRWKRHHPHPINEMHAI